MYKWTYVKHMLLKYRCENKVESETACKSETCYSEGSLLLANLRSHGFKWVLTTLISQESEVVIWGKETLILADQPTFAGDLVSKVNLVIFTSFCL